MMRSEMKAIEYRRYETSGLGAKRTFGQMASEPSGRPFRLAEKLEKRPHFQAKKKFTPGQAECHDLPIADMDGNEGSSRLSKCQSTQKFLHLREPGKRSLAGGG